MQLCGYDNIATFVVSLKFTQMKTDTQQVRKVKDLTCHPESIQFYGTQDYDIRELVRSIKQFGILQPLVIYGNEVQVGNRRLRAAQMLKMEEVPVIEAESRFTINKVIGSQVYRVKPPSIIIKELRVLDSALGMRQGRRTDLSQELKLEIEKWRSELDKTPGAIARYRKMYRYGDLVFGTDEEKWIEFFNRIDDGRFSITSALRYLRSKYLREERKKHEHFFMKPNVDFDIYRTDAFSMKEIDDATIQCIITQPPSYVGGTQENPPLGNENSQVEYITRLVSFMEEAKRVLKPEGSLWIVLGDVVKNGNYSLLPHQFALKMMENGWILNDEIVWKHAVNNPSPVRRTARGHKYLFHFVLRDDFTYFPSNIPTKPSYPGAFSTSLIATAQTSVTLKKKAAKNKGIELNDDTLVFNEYVPYIPMLLTSDEGDVVLDMFNGLGTTGMVALAHGRYFVGYDTDKTLNHIAEDLLDNCGSKLSLGQNQYEMELAVAS